MPKFGLKCSNFNTNRSRSIRSKGNILISTDDRQTDRPISLNQFRILANISMFCEWNDKFNIHYVLCIVKHGSLEIPTIVKIIKIFGSKHNSFYFICPIYILHDFNNSFIISFFKIYVSIGVEVQFL